MLKNIALISIFSWIICSCAFEEKSTKSKIVKKFYDKHEKELEYEAYYSAGSLKVVKGYTMDGDLVDSLFRVENSFNYEIIDNDLHIGDTLIVSMEFSSPQFQDKYVLLTDSITVDELLYSNSYQYEDYNGDITLSFLITDSGRSYISGILFNTSVEVLEYINDNEFIGKRKGMFEVFKIEFDVSSRKN